MSAGPRELYFPEAYMSENSVHQATAEDGSQISDSSKLDCLNIWSTLVIAEQPQKGSLTSLIRGEIAVRTPKPPLIIKSTLQYTGYFG